MNQFVVSCIQLHCVLARTRCKSLRAPRHRNNDNEHGPYLVETIISWKAPSISVSPSDHPGCSAAESRSPKRGVTPRRRRSDGNRPGGTTRPPPRSPPPPWRSPRRPPRPGPAVKRSRKSVSPRRSPRGRCSAKRPAGLPAGWPPAGRPSGSCRGSGPA